jgi:uncharacterized protein (DUF2267 family)
MDSLQDVTSGQRIDDDQFLAVIEAAASLPRQVRPETAAIVTMCTLARRLTPGQARQLLDALPSSVRMMFAPCMQRGGEMVEKIDDAGFLDLVAHRLELTPAHAEIIADAIFKAVRALLPIEVIRHVATQLSGDLSDLWLGEREPIFDAMTQAEGSPQLALLGEIYDAVPLPIGVTPTDALSAVLCAFTRRVSGGESLDLLLGLPEDVRPLVDRCFLHRGELAEVFGRDQLVARVADELATSPRLAEDIIDAAFTAVKHQLPEKEIDDVASQLPPDLRATCIAA